MHQILGLRLWFNEKKQKHEKTDNTFFGRNWRFSSIKELFENLDSTLKQIPEKERWDLYYTVPVCGDKKREFKEQHVIIFDIDGIDNTKHGEYVKTICSCLGVKESETGIVASGNGLHVVIGLKTAIQDVTYFEKNRRHFSALCDKLKLALTRVSLPGEPDPAVFDHRRIMRLPGTENRKEGKAPQKCRILQPHIVDTDFDLIQASGLPAISAADQIQPQTLKKYATPDTNAIVEGCEFLKHCKEKPNEVSEAQWYAMLSILPRLPPNGRTLAHEFSSGHRSYNHGECETKIDQALQASGPRTCGNIQNLWGKCEACPNFGKVNSPIMIQGPKYIKTQDSGFYNVYTDDNGNLKKGKPNYDDLVLYFESLHDYRNLDESRITYVWAKTHWKEITSAALETFAEKHFDPTPLSKMRMEFRTKVACRNTQDAPWWKSSTHRKINFRNGVLDLGSMELTPHSTQYGFRSCLEYDYDPNAKAPHFEKFLHEIMKGRADLVDILLEFVGYAFSNDKCWAQKALIMTGVGSNGKSTFMDVLKALAGEDNFSSLTLSDIKSETSRKMLDGKLFNLAEETPSYAMVESSVFKNLITGGEATVKVLYKQPYQIALNAKLMFACNELPKTKDTTRGYFRRLLIVPFDVIFDKTGANYDPFILEKLLTELPGIFNLVNAGYQRLRAQKGFSESKVVDAEVESYRKDIDTVRAWFEDAVEVFDLTSPARASLQQLYSSYSFYCMKVGEKPEVRSTLARRLRHIMPQYEERKTNPRAENRETCFQGISCSEKTDF